MPDVETTEVAREGTAAPNNGVTGCLGVAEHSVAEPNLPMKCDLTEAPTELVPSDSVHSFHLHTDEHALIEQVMRAYGIEAAVDQSVRAQVVPFDAADVGFADAEAMVQLATNTFFVPLAAQRVLALGDTKENRAKYERQVSETITFPGFGTAELTDMLGIAQTVLASRRSAVDMGQHSLTVRAPVAELAALNRIYAGVVAGRSELQLDVHIYEIDRSKETNVGVILPNTATLFNLSSEVNEVLGANSSLVEEIIASGQASAGDWQKIIAILIASGALSGTVFNSPFAVFGGGLTESGVEWNSIAANMLLNSSEVRSLDQIQLRVLDREEATFRSGQRYPVISGAFSTLSVTGSATQTIPQVQYAELGLTVKVRPYIEEANGIDLHVDLKLDALGGEALNNIPILTTRQFNGVVSVHAGASALLVSAMSRQDAQQLTGVPGLSEVAGTGGATNRQNSLELLELVVLITPHIIRAGNRDAAEPMILLPLH